MGLIYTFWILQCCTEKTITLSWGMKTKRNSTETKTRKKITSFSEMSWKSMAIYLSNGCLPWICSSGRCSFMIKQLNETVILVKLYKECRRNLHLGENRNVFSSNLVVHWNFISLHHTIMVGKCNYAMTLSIMLVSLLSKLSTGF